MRFWVKSLVARCYKDYVNRKILDRMGMTLRSLEIYGYIGSKTKNYWILGRFLLLFIFHTFWLYKAGLPCFLNKQVFLLIILLKPSFSGLLEFPDLFPNKPFCWELQGLCPRADCISTIPWIIAEYLVIQLAALNFSHTSNRINHLTKSMHRTLWWRQYPTVSYLLRLASRAIGHQALLVPNWGYDLKKALD